MTSHCRNGTSSATLSARWCRTRSKSYSRKIAGLLCGLTAVALTVALLAACAPKAPAPALTRVTVGTLAESGKTVYMTKCSGCHGTRGEGVTGPPLIGSAASLEKYNNAKALYDFTRVAMPFSAPGSLSEQEYLQVLGYLIHQNSFAPPEQTVDPSGLGSLVLKK